MTEYKKDFPEFYITAPQACPYLPGRLERKLFTHLTNDKPNKIVDNLLTGGFRRSQNIAYIPYCDACTACVSVRILVKEFEVTKSLKRVERRNSDLIIDRVNAKPTSEQYSLFRTYIDQRHAEGGMADMTVLDYAMMIEDSVVDTFLTEYRVPHPSDGKRRANEAGELIAVCLCDRLSDGISMVYSFFDPEMTDRSLGTYMILDQVRYAQSLDLDYLYLGYWIEGARKMAYKRRFGPQEQLSPKGWVRR